MGLVIHLGVQLHADIGGYIAFPETPAGIFVNCVLIALPAVLGSAAFGHLALIT